MLEITILSVGGLLILIAIIMLFLDAYGHNKPAAIFSLLLVFPLIGSIMLSSDDLLARNYWKKRVVIFH